MESTPPNAQRRLSGGIVSRAAAERRNSITKTERRRSANLLQMPRGLMCKLRQRGRGYGSPAASRGIDPSLQPPPWRAYMGSADALLSGSISDVGVNGFVR